MERVMGTWIKKEAAAEIQARGDCHHNEAILRAISARFVTVFTRFIKPAIGNKSLHEPTVKEKKEQ